MVDREINLSFADGDNIPIINLEMYAEDFKKSTKISSI